MGSDTIDPDERIFALLQRPRPPRREVEPGAFYDDGRNARDVSASSDDSEESTRVQEPNNDYQEEVPAMLVDAEEEERIRREKVEREVQEKLEQKERNTSIAKVITGFWCSRRTKIISASFLVMAILAVALGIGIWIRLKPPPPPGPIEELTTLLSSVSFDNGAALRTESTPQYDALVWLANDTNLDSYSESQKIQRYSLTTLYFASNGSQWSESDGWLQGDDECTWLGCRCFNGSITGIGLQNNSLYGKIPEEIALMSHSLGTFPSLSLLLLLLTVAFT